MISPKDFHLLVVDDNDDLRNTILSTFLLFGFNVDSAEDGMEALEKCKENEYQIIITDVRMPRMDGIELLKEVKKKNAIFPKVFVITGFSDYDLAEIYHFGGDGLFKKPFNATTIKECITQALLDPKERLAPLLDAQNSFNISKIFTDLDSSAKNKEFHLGRLGFFISLDDHLPEVGEKVRFDIEFSKESSIQQFKGVGQVLWRRGDNNKLRKGIGVELLHIQEDQIDNYLQYLKVNNIIPSIPME